jgi:hypothetical protein
MEVKMKNEKNALAGMLALGITLTSTNALADMPDWTKNLKEVDKC